MRLPSGPRALPQRHPRPRRAEHGQTSGVGSGVVDVLIDGTTIASTSAQRERRQSAKAPIP
jgi:hypothetical protein